MFLTHLRDRLSIKGIRRVSMHEPLTNLRKVIFLQFAQGVPRTEVWRALHGASSLLADCGKICVAVSEDIDPTNTDGVFWSLAYRSNPADDVHIMPYRSAGHGPKSGAHNEESTILIDATLKHSAPPLALPAREFMERAHLAGAWPADASRARPGTAIRSATGPTTGKLCAPRREGRVGSEWARHLHAAAA
jgi:4-hydroxy-3-polyprenylbenzoate decarboxylase